MSSEHPYPPIADYALIGDCHGSALVSRSGSIDWCCMPRMDSPSIFGRLLDWEKGGHFRIAPASARAEGHRAYLERTTVLETTFDAPGGACRLLDCFAMREGGTHNPHRRLLRVVECTRGKLDMELVMEPRFDYGALRPWLRRAGERAYAAIGGSNGLVIGFDHPLAAVEHRLESRFTIRAGERARFSMTWRAPEQIDVGSLQVPSAGQIDEELEETLEWWRRWASQETARGIDAAAILRSSLVLKSLTYAPTGAVVAAATTSLPETPGGTRNWDYRFSWIRDSSLSVHSLTDAGFVNEADGFRRFIQRSAAGSAHDLQIMYGVGGERSLVEIELEHLEGYGGARPVRIGNGASTQLQLDAFGDLMLLSWRWHRRGRSPDDDYWRFIVDLVETVIERWREPDQGIWESRGKPLHFVHSKACCWAAVSCGIALAEECARKAPRRRWTAVAREIKAAIEDQGYDRRRGIFRQAFGRTELDSALLLLPSTGFCDWTDPRMVRTVDAIRAELMDQGLLLRYRPQKMDDGVARTPEGAFTACSFWLAEGLARQGRLEEATEVYDRAASTANDLGLYSEESDPRTGTMLGNFPQALTHLSQMAAAIALQDARAGRP